MGSIEIDRDCRHVVLDSHTDQGTHATICRSGSIRIPLASVSLRNIAGVFSLPPVSARELYLETFART